MKNSIPFSNMATDDWLESVRLWLKYGAPLIAQAPSRKCPVCCGDGRALFNSHDGYPFSECWSCGCWYVPHQIDERLFEKFFACCGYAKVLADRMIEKRIGAEMTQTDQARLEGYFDELIISVQSESANIRYLDVGCGVGHSVMVAGRRGIDAYGVDVNKKAVEVGRKKGLRLFDSSDDVPEREFEWISFWETLEHMVDPLAELSRYKNRLAPDGLIALTVPNLNGLGVRLQKGDCSYVHGGRAWAGHVNWFNVELLKVLLGRAGLDILFVDGQFGHNLFDLISYLLGESRAAADSIAGPRHEMKFPVSTFEAVNAIGPAVTLMERLTLTSPIIKVVACRSEEAGRLNDVRENLNRSRRSDLAAQALVLGS
ncbi:MAG: class I SAM-dependent methyltransferase [Desulfobulbaceae bacterium]|nr:class I SAM-dependent methyltransferase [Desulfobulbaceae bacterium]